MLAVNVGSAAPTLRVAGLAPIVIEAGVTVIVPGTTLIA